MKCDEFLSAMETGGFIQRMRARHHAGRCRRCASEHAAFVAAMRQWATPEPLSPDAKRLWQQAAIEVESRPARGKAWKLATAGAVAGVSLTLICALWVLQRANKRPAPSSEPTVASRGSRHPGVHQPVVRLQVSEPAIARREARHLSPITIEQINPSQGLAHLSNEVLQLSAELKELQQRIEKKQVQNQIAATLERFGEPPSLPQSRGVRQ